MKSGQLLVFDGVGKPLRLVQMELPALKTGEVLVKNSYTTFFKIAQAANTGANQRH